MGEWERDEGCDEMVCVKIKERERERERERGERGESDSVGDR